MSYIKKPSRTNIRYKKKVFNYSFSNIITKNSSKILTLYFDFVEYKKFDFTLRPPKVGVKECTFNLEKKTYLNSIFLFTKTKIN